MSQYFPYINQALFWGMVLFFSVWGGIVRYLMDRRSGGRRYSRRAILSQIIISSFTGALGGFYSHEQGWSEYMTLVVAGLSSTLGGSFLRGLWRRILQAQENNK